MTDPELGAAYRQAFADTQDSAVRRMRAFVQTLPPGHGARNRQTRWVLPVGVAAAVAAVAVTTVAIAAGGSNVTGSVNAPAGIQPVLAAGPSAYLSVSRTVSPSSTAFSTPLTTRPARSTAPSGPSPTSASTAPTVSPSRHLSPPLPTSPTSRVSTVSPTPPPPTLPRLTMSSKPSSLSGPSGSTVRTTNGTQGARATSTYPTIGDPGITGPLAPYARASSYTKVPAGLVVRTPADNVSSQNGVATEFSMFISAANEDPKVVVGGYLVIVAAPSIHYQSIDGQGPSSTPAGAALHLGDRLWHWNADHTLLISTSADADVYIGVLAARAMNEFEPTIPTGYHAADIELIAAGLRA